jgi:hypothetical protein
MPKEIAPNTKHTASRRRLVCTPRRFSRSSATQPSLFHTSGGFREPTRPGSYHHRGEPHVLSSGCLIYVQEGGVVVSYKSVRHGRNNFGHMFARRLRRDRLQPRSDALDAIYARRPVGTVSYTSVGRARLCGTAHGARAFAIEIFLFVNGACADISGAFPLNDTTRRNR